MSTIHAEARTASPPQPEPPRAGTRRRVIAVAGVIALILGVAGGYLLRWGTESTRTVTKTVTKTVTAPAYTAATSVVAGVSFDGTRAYYSGPAELKAGTTLTVAFTTTVKGSSLAVSRLEPAPTWDKLVSDLESANTAPEPMPLSYVHNVGGVDGAGQAVVHLNRAGVYSLWAGPLAVPTSTASVALATMLRVTP